MISDQLSKVSIFEGLTSEELDALSEVTEPRRIAKNALVILAEEEGDTFFVINRGRLKVSVTAADGREVILSVLGSGDFFGDMALLDDRPRSANVTTMEESDLFVVRRADFRKALEGHPSIAVKLMVSLATRLRRADRQTAGMALLGITDRICSMLLTLAEDHAEETEEGLLLRNRPTHQVLANMAGTARETFTRVLKRLEDEGYVSSRGKDLLILKRDEDESDDG